MLCPVIFLPCLQFSISTSGSSLRLLEHLFKSDPVLQHLKHTVIPSWYQRPGYVGAMVDLIEAELDKFDQPGDVRGEGFRQGSSRVQARRSLAGSGGALRAVFGLNMASGSIGVLLFLYCTVLR